MLDLKETMWLFVCFDLPTTTAPERARATKFRNFLLTKGFVMFQYSIYIRHCGKPSFTDVIERFVESIVPPGGTVALIRIKDQQFGNIKKIEKGKPKHVTTKPEPFLQLTIF